VAGTAYDQLYTWPRAFFYDGSKAKDIGALDGVAASALSINDSDAITGYLTTTDFFDHAFRFSNGVMTDLGTLGGHYSYAISINNSNIIVGGSFTDDLDSIYHAFIWNGNTMQDLNDLLPPGTGWVLGEARCINDLGQIAGTGTYNGEKHAFLLQPTSTTTFRITSIQKDGANVVLQFPTLAQATYAVEANQTLSNNAWTTVIAGLPGNGGTLSVTNSISADRTRFFRVKQTEP
jgi:probable HAF family extracellular repeat protein